MPMRVRHFILATSMLAALGMGGCERLFQKDSERAVNAGDKKTASGDYRMAIKLYEAAFDGTANTAEVHYKLGVIYDDKLKDPLNALHHFNRYLDLDPRGTHAKDARACVQAGTLRLAESLNKGSMITQEEAVRIKKENLDLRLQLVAIRGQKTAPVATPIPGKKLDGGQKPIPPGTRTYVVQSGDTMASIAAKFYKNKARWKDIQDANFYSTAGTPKIKAGQTLIIP